MNHIFWGLLLPLIGTSAGAACVFVMRRQMRSIVQKTLLGFASGVMVAASVWSLLIPAMEMSADMGKLAFLPAACGFIGGIAFLLALDWLIPHLHLGSNEAEGHRSRLRKTTMMTLAVTLHNIPEGMAVGLAFALAARDGGLGLAAAVTLALGIGIQNFPEGAAVALPLRQSGMSRMRAFALGTLSGAVEPVFGVLVVLAATVVRQAMPLLMAFSAGAMMYVVICEMIPEASGERSGTRFAMVGYIVMMALDIALG